MKLTERYLRNMIKQAINEMNIDMPPMSSMPPIEPMSNFSEQPVDTELLSSLEEQGYKVIEIGNGSYEIVHPTDSFKSYILEPKLTGEPRAPKPPTPAPSYEPPARPSDDEYRKFLAMRNRNG